MKLGFKLLNLSFTGRCIIQRFSFHFIVKLQRFILQYTAFILTHSREITCYKAENLGIFVPFTKTVRAKSLGNTCI